MGKVRANVARQGGTEVCGRNLVDKEKALGVHGVAKRDAERK